MRKTKRHMRDVYLFQFSMCEESQIMSAIPNGQLGGQEEATGTLATDTDSESDIILGEEGDASTSAWESEDESED